jgi:hypothetical protein
MKELMDCKAFKQYLRFLKDNKLYSHTITNNGTETKRYLSEIRYKDYKEKGYESRYTKNSIAYIQQLTNMLIPLSVPSIEYKSITNKFFKSMILENAVKHIINFFIERYTIKITVEEKTKIIKELITQFKRDIDNANTRNEVFLMNNGTIINDLISKLSKYAKLKIEPTSTTSIIRYIIQSIPMEE